MKILDLNHIITGDEYFRQINFYETDSDNYAKCSFITKWMYIRYLLGPIWKGKVIKELNNLTTDYYEFVLFDNEDEKKLTKIFNDKTIKIFDNLKWNIFRLWDDWIFILWKSLNDFEKKDILTFDFNKCPSCKKSYLSKNKTCKCGFGWNKLHDDYIEYEKECKEIINIQKYVKENNLI